MSILSITDNPLVNIWITMILCTTIMLLYVVKRLLNQANNTTKPKSKQSAKVKNQMQQPRKETKTKDTTSKTKKKNTENQRFRTDKQNFSHSWLLTSFKGHTGEILDIDFSSNGKYLASCSEDALDPGGESITSSVSESSLNKDQPDLTTTVNNRKARRKANRLRKKQRSKKSDETTSSSGSSPELRKKNMSKHRITEEALSPVIVALYPPLRNHTKLNISESVLSCYLRKYLLPKNLRYMMGYPFKHENYTMIYIQPRQQNDRKARLRASRFDVNAREFVPGVGYQFLNKKDDLNSEYDSDSGQGSGTSSPTSERSDEIITDRVTMERECVRCYRPFFIGPNSQYLSQEPCNYHSGRCYPVMYSPHSVEKKEYTCCRGNEYSIGCVTEKFHVWNGVIEGLNGPLEGYVTTRYKQSIAQDEIDGVYAVDCEMCYTAEGLLLTKVTVVTTDGRLVYDSYARPHIDIVDYNSRYSGITAKDLCKNSNNCVKTLQQIQSDLTSFISGNTILIGHGLENDLRALRILHSRCIDTTAVFPHKAGLPMRRGLKALTREYLQRDIQCAGDAGHDSVEDARACMDLLLWKVRYDYRHELQQCA